MRIKSHGRKTGIKFNQKLIQEIEIKALIGRQN